MTEHVLPLTLGIEFGDRPSGSVLLSDDAKLTLERWIGEGYDVEINFTAQRVGGSRRVELLAVNIFRVGASPTEEAVTHGDKEGGGG